MEVRLCSILLLLVLAMAVAQPGIAITNGALQQDLHSTTAMATLTRLGAHRQLLHAAKDGKGPGRILNANDDDNDDDGGGGGGYNNHGLVSGTSLGSVNPVDKRIAGPDNTQVIVTSGDEPKHEDSQDQDHEHENVEAANRTSGQEFILDELLASMQVPKDSEVLYFEDGETCSTIARQEIKKMCDFLDVGQRCPPVSDKGDSQSEDTLLLSKCQGGNCTTVWSQHRSACFLEALSRPEPFSPNRGNLTCGIPQSTWDLFNLSPAPLVETHPADEGGISCGLGFSRDVEIRRHLICVDGTPRLAFQYTTRVVAPQGADYYCILDSHCTDDVPYMFICYISAGNETSIQKGGGDDSNPALEEVTLLQKMRLLGIPEDADIMYFKDGASCPRDAIPQDVNMELTKACEFFELGLTCAPQGAQDPLFTSTCRNGSCLKIWSPEHTECILREWGYEVSVESGGNEEESDESSICGLPGTTWNNLRAPASLYTMAAEQEGHVSCGLGLPSGVQIKRYLDCIDGVPVFVFEYDTDKEMFPANVEYTCAFNSQCNATSPGVFPGFSICYSRVNGSVINGQPSVKTPGSVPGQLALLGVPTGAQVVFLNDSQSCGGTEPGKKIKRELRSICEFMSVSSRCCCDTESSDRGFAGHIVATCREGFCKDIWSHNQTLCYLRETGHSVGGVDGTQRSEAASEDLVCGLPADTWHVLHQGVPMYDIPLEMENELACSLGLPRGVTMEMQLNCVQRVPRLQITTNLEYSLAKRGEEYKCIFFDGECNENNHFSGSSVCYLKLENESRSVPLAGEPNLGSGNMWNNSKDLFFGLLLASVLVLVLEL